MRWTSRRVWTSRSIVSFSSQLLNRWLLLDELWDHAVVLQVIKQQIFNVHVVSLDEARMFH